MSSKDNMSSFCLGIPLGQPVDISCLWSPTGHEGLIELLLHLDSITCERLENESTWRQSREQDLII